MSAVAPARPHPAHAPHADPDDHGPAVADGTPPPPNPSSPSPSALPAGPLTATTAAAIVGYVRVFDGADFLPTLLAAALGAHLLSAVLRRRGVPMLLGSLAQCLAVLLVGSWTLFPGTLRFGLPATATARALGDAVTSSWEQVDAVVTPVEPEPGFLVVAFLATWVAAIVADHAAFRWWTTLQALVPATALFVVGAALARGTTGRGLVAGTFVAAALAFVLLQRPLVLTRRHRWRWMALGEASGLRAIRATGVLLILVCCVLGALLGVRLPGGDTSSLLSWRPGEGGGQRQTVSPLVDIRSRLVDQGDQVLFTVESAAPAYWRTTSLDVFDGRVWRSEGTFSGADGDLEPPEDEVVGDTELEQRIEVVALDQIWLPAAFRPVAVEADGTPVRYDPESSTLIVDSELPSSDGAVYTVRSARVEHAPADLAAATDPPPPEIADRYLALPTDFSPRAQLLAREVTVDAVTPYDQAVALEAFFRQQFEYSTDVQDGHDEAAIDAFLERRTGYCEQFAGTYAAMARSLGLPSRVAIGFVPGDPDPDAAGTYVVRGRDSHAWPEVWLTGIGWVGMEPTPSREEPPAVPPTTTTSAPSPATTTPSGAVPTSPPSPQEGGDEQALDPSSGPSGTPAWLLPALGGLAFVALLIAVPALQGMRRRHLLAHGAPGERVAGAWALALEDLRAVGLRARPAETPSELARRGDALEVAPPGSLGRLAEGVTAARFAPGEVDEQVARRAAQDADAVAEAVDARLGSWARWRRRFDPRRLRRGATRLRA